MPSRFVVEDGEILDTRNREIISRDQLAQLATPAEQAQMDDEIEASGWAGADQSLDTPEVARSSSTTAPQVDTTPSTGPLSSSPSLDEFMRVAKQDNPGIPDSSLRKYWAQKYGKINPKTLPSLETFMPAAREDNPDLPDDVLRAHWQERYGDFGAAETEPKVGFGGTLLEGAKSAGRSLKAAGQALIGDSSGVADTAAAQQSADKDPALERLLLDIQKRKDSLGKDPSFLDTAGELGKAVLQNPKGAGLLLTEQLPNSAVAMGSAAAGFAAGTALGGPVGGIVGGLAGLFGANTALETGSKAIEAGSDQDFTPEDRTRVLTEGAQKGAVITGIDAASLGFTNWITGTTTRAVERATMKALTDAGVDVADKAAVLAARSNPAIVESIQLAQKNATAAVNTLGQKLSRGAGALGVESIGEGAGEYLGEYAASGNPDKMEALIEAFAGLGQSAGEIVTTQALNRRRGDAARLPPEAPVQAIGHTQTAAIPGKLGVGDPTVGIDHSIATAWELLNEDTEAQERNAIAAQKQAERQLLQGPSPSLEIPRTGTEIPILQGPESPQTWTPRIAPGHAFTPRETPEPNALEQMRTERRGLIWDEMQQPNATQSDMPQPAMSVTPPESDIPLQSAADLAYPPSERGKIPTQQDLLRQQNREQPRSGYEVPTLPAAQQDASPLITPGSVFTPRATVQPTPQEGIEAERHRIRTEQKAAERAKILSMKRTKPVALPPQSYDEPAQLKQDVPLTKAIDRAYPSVSMLHEIAQAKGFDIDSQVFKTITKMVTGKEHLDSLTPGERDRFAEKLGRMEAHKTPAVVESATQSALKPVKPVAPSNDAITAPRSALPPEKNAEMLLRAEKAKADLEIDQALPQVPIVKFLKDKGGVQDQGGELSTMEVDGERAPFSKNLINEKGMTLDDAAELAHEAGYIQARDISLLLDSIDRETRGQGGKADWYQTLTTGPKPLSRKAIDAAIEKIIKDHGLDTGKAVERVKSALLNDGEFDGSQWGEDAASILRGDWPEWIEKPSAPLQSGPAASQQPVSASPPTEGTTTLRPSTEAAKRFGYVLDGMRNASAIDTRAQEAATSEQNALPDPTDAQKKSGTYLKGHLNLSGLDISIENPEWSERSGTDTNGKPWRQKMTAHYGYIRSIQKDGKYFAPKDRTKEHIDVFVKPGTPEDYSGPVFVVDQNDPTTGKFDEYKVIIGADTEEDAKAIYLSNYAADWNGFRSIKQFSMPEFKLWLQAGNKQKPVGVRKPTPTQQIAKNDNLEIPPTSSNLTSNEGSTEEPFSLTSQEIKAPKAKEEDRQTSLDIPPETVGSRPIIGREVTPEEAPLFSEAAKQPDAEQLDMTQDQGEVTPKAAPEVAPSPTEILASALRTAADQIEGKETEPKKPSAPQPGALTDVGEELWYNRRNRTAGGIKWSDIENLNDTLKTKEVTKIKVWPRPDYEQLIAEGMHPFTAHMVKQMYDSIAAAPDTTYAGRKKAPTDQQLQDYIETVQKLREEIFSWAKDVNAQRAMVDRMMNEGKSYAGQLTDLASLMKSAKDGIIGQIWHKDPETRRWVDANGRATTGLVGGNKLFSALQPGFDEAKRATEALKEGWPAAQEAWQKQFEIKLTPKGETVWTKEGKRTLEADEYWIVKKSKSRGSRMIVASGFPTREEAIAKAKELAATNRGGTGPQEERIELSHITRIGPEHRKPGQTISPQELKDAFGFRGVNFGNWTNQAERQAHVNHAYDSFMDLAGILNIPPNALSLNGLLGLAFGAQGSGAYAAHFVPGVNEINLTKTQGAGSLAHEWAHALDHYLSVQAGHARGDDPFLTHVADAGQAIRGEIRPEMVEAVKTIVETMKKREATQEEIAADLADRQAKNIKGLNSWLLAIGRRIPEDKRAAYDAIAEKIRLGNVGDGLIPLGSSNTSAISPRVKELRDAYKDAMGHTFSADEAKAIQSWVGSILYARKTKAEDVKHIPQRSTSYLTKATELDKDRKGKGYWTQPTELLARAFQSYVMDKLSERAHQNDYLTRPQHRAPDRYPQGEERVRINAAFDTLVSEIETKETDQGTAIYEPTSDYLDNSVEPSDNESTPSQIALDKAGPYVVRAGEQQSFNFDLARQALGDLDRAGEDVSTVGGKTPLPGDTDDIRTIALGFTPALIREGVVNLAGQRAASAEDIAKLAQVYRDPRFETFRTIYMKGDAIVGHEGVTSRLPGMVKVFPSPNDITDTLLRMQDRMREMGADGYYVLHNHPSGRSMPSRMDYDLTVIFAERVPGFLGHVVIDSNEYSVIDRSNIESRVQQLHALDLGEDELLRPSIDHPLLGTRINSHGEVAHVGKGIQSPEGWATVIYQSSNSVVRAIQEVSLDFLTNIPKSKAYIQQQAVTFGASRVFTYSKGRPSREQAALTAFMRRLIEDETITDHVTDFGDRISSMYDMGISPKLNMYLGRNINDIGHEPVMEEQTAYAPSISILGDTSLATVPPSQQQAAIGYHLPAMSKLDDVVRTLQDKNIDLVRLVESIKAAGKTVADEVNPVLKEELYMGRVSKLNEDFLTGELRPLVDAMRLNKVTMPQLDTYLHARHAKEANAHLKAINPDREDNEALSGMTDAEADAILNAADRPKMDRLAARVDAILAKSRSLLVEYGLEKPETVEQWAADYQHYVPLHREGYEEGTPGTGQGRSVRGPHSKARTGSNLAVTNILANVALDREKVITRGEKMRPVIALAGLLQQFPNEEVARLVKPRPMTYTNPDTGLQETAPGDIGDYRVPRIKGINKKTGKVEWRPDPLYKGRENVVNFRLHGEDHAIVFNEDNERSVKMARALKDLDVGQLNGVLSTIAPVTRYFSAISTQYNPIFGLINIIRDAQFAMLSLSTTPLAGSRAKVAKAITSSLLGIYQDARAVRAGRTPSSATSALWERFQKVGGPTGYKEMFRGSNDRADAIEHLLDPDWWQKTLGGKILTANGHLSGIQSLILNKAAKPFFDWLTDYNSAMENAVRLAAFKVAIEQGESDERAASIAKNLTVNFNKKGAVTTQLGAMYAFFNASVQGTARIADTLFEKGKFGVLSATGKKIVAGGMAIGSMQAIAMLLAGFDDDQPPEFVRSRSLIIPVPGTEKGYVAIPMPLGFNILPNFGRLMTETLIYGKPLDRAWTFASSLVDTFSPVGGAGSVSQFLSPTVADPLVALSENKDWAGRKISKEDLNSLKPTPGHTRAKDSSTPWARGLSEAINYATGGSAYTPGKLSPTPDSIDYLIGSLTGGVGREVAHAAQTATGLTTGEDVPLYKVPLVGRFVGDASGAAAMKGAFYDNLKEVNEAYAELKGRRLSGEDTADFRMEHPEAALESVASKLEHRISELNKKKRRLISDGASREQVKLIEQNIEGTMRRFNDRVRELQAR